MIHGWRRAAAPLAVVLGPLVIIVAVLRNWHGWEAAPFWLDDTVAGFALVGAGIFALHDQDSVRGRLLSAAYALSVGVMWGSLFEPLAGLHPKSTSWGAFANAISIVTLGGLLATIAGLLLSIPPSRPAFVGTRHEPKKTKGRR